LPISAAPLCTTGAARRTHACDSGARILCPSPVMRTCMHAGCSAAADNRRLQPPVPPTMRRPEQPGWGTRVPGTDVPPHMGGVPPVRMLSKATKLPFVRRAVPLAIPFLLLASPPCSPLCLRTSLYPTPPHPTPSHNRTGVRALGLLRHNLGD
jgi:hypothetical protein